MKEITKVKDNKGKLNKVFKDGRQTGVTINLLKGQEPMTLSSAVWPGFLDLHGVQAIWIAYKGGPDEM